MIENINNNPAAYPLGPNTAPQASVTNRPATDDLDATLQVNFADMVNQALQAADEDADAVQNARELLQSNRLTTPENIRAAAEDILTFGI